MRDATVPELTIDDAGARFRSGDLSPLDLVEAHIKRAEGDRLNAIATLTADHARADAERARRELASGVDRGPLHGIPISLKDNIDVAGVRTTAGSLLYADRIPATDATITRKLREAGAVLIGKANMHELALGVETDNPVFGRTRNPLDPMRIPGGSSGGSAAAVVAGIGLASIGTDSGGSVRIPAALCGLVGLKPTHGRVSNAGIIPNYPSFDCAGPIARTVEDVAHVLRAIAGYDPADFATIRVPVDDYAHDLAAGITRLRIGVPRSLFASSARADVLATFEVALSTYRELGVQVVDVDLQGDLTRLKEAARPELGERYANDLRTRPQDIRADVRAKLEGALATGLEDHMRARRASEALTAELRAALEKVDVLALPTVPVTAPQIGIAVVPFGEGSADLEDALVAYVRLFNLARLPALTHPCGAGEDGLPVGLQLVGRPLDESLVLCVAHAFEKTRTTSPPPRSAEDPGREWMRATH
jgi:aspartyl-tRNA(Asn)/glutamyl-tRNA(Gln) amidotransferase subunit A